MPTKQQDINHNTSAALRAAQNSRLRLSVVAVRALAVEHAG